MDTNGHDLGPHSLEGSARLQSISSPMAAGQDIKAKECLEIVVESKDRCHKRKRGQSLADPNTPDRDQLTSKRVRPTPANYNSGADPQIRSDTSDSHTGAVEIWTRTHSWPRRFFQEGPDRLFSEHDSWLDEQMAYSYPVVQYVEINGFKYPRPIRKLPVSIGRKRSNPSLSDDSSEQKTVEAQSAAYRDTRYTTLLAIKGGHMKEANVGITDASIHWCQMLLDSEQTVPSDTMFRDDIFQTTCALVQGRNKARVIRSISPYIVPSAEDQEILRAIEPKCLIENINEGWINAIPVEGPRPQPDYCVGFRRSAFTAEQLRRLHSVVGSVFDTSFFVSTYRMYFPFLTCEVKCGAAGLDIADRQNAHSMTIAVRGIVELYKAVNREKELHREILAFSISHDDMRVRIYGHYPIIGGDQTAFYRHPIDELNITLREGRDKWTAYKFTKNVYDVWMPAHLKRLCSAIDQLPRDLNFEVSRDSDVQFVDATQLSGELGATDPS